MVVEKVSVERGLQWFTEGFALFRAAPLIWVVDVILFIVVLSLLSMVPFMGSIAATLLQPVLIAGLMKGCADLSRGGELRLEHLMLGFSERTKPLLMLGMLLGLASLAILVSLLVFTFGTGLLGAVSSGPGDWAESIRNLPDPVVLFGGLLVLSLALLLSLPLAMASWFSPALVMFNDCEPWDAMKASFVGCLRNMWPFLVYGLALLGTLLLALIPFGLGLLVWTPVLLTSMFVGYRDIFPDRISGTRSAADSAITDTPD